MEIRIPPFCVVEVTENGKVERFLVIPGEAYNNHHLSSSLYGIKLDGDGFATEDKITCSYLSTYESNSRKMRVIPDVEVRIMVRNGAYGFRVLETVPKHSPPVSI